MTAWILSLACQSWREQQTNPSVNTVCSLRSSLSRERERERFGLWLYEARPSVAWLALTGCLAARQPYPPLICLVHNQASPTLLPRHAGRRVVHKQYFHQHPPPNPPLRSGCWSRKWIFYSSLVWSITYKLLLYFVAGGREGRGEDSVCR